MKKKSEQRLLQFPSVFNLEPGGKAEEESVNGKKMPEWKKEVVRKVEQHRKLREHRKDSGELNSIDENIKLDAEKDTLDERFSLQPKSDEEPQRIQMDALNITPDKSTPSELDRIILEDTIDQSGETAFPESVEDRLQTSDDEDIKKKFAEVHQQLLQTGSNVDDEESAELTSIEPGAAFDEIDLNKSPLPIFSELAEEETTDPDSLSQNDYFMPLGELLSRHQKKEARRPKEVTASPDRTILVSRFLSGLIDSVILLILTSIFTQTMAWFFGGMFVVLLYIYSFYFLFLTGKTAGMMMVGLQVKSDQSDRLSPTTVLLRTTFFLLGIACFFLGLIWGIFDREAKCWQDILSGTTVVRVS